MESLRSWVSENKLTSIGTLWVTAIGASLVYTGARSSLKPSLRLIHARMHAQALTLGVLSGAAILHHFDDGKKLGAGEDGREKSQRESKKPSKCVVFEDDPRGITAAHNCTMMAVALIGSHPAYELVQVDLAVASYSELSVINLRRLFAHKGSTFKDLQKQVIEKSPPKRKLTIDTIRRWAKIQDIELLKLHIKFQENGPRCITMCNGK